MDIPFADLPAACHVNERSRLVKGIVEIDESMAPYCVERLRILFHGPLNPQDVSGVRVSLASIPERLQVEIADGAIDVKVGSGVKGAYVLKCFGKNVRVHIGAGTSANGIVAMLNGGGGLSVGEDVMFAEGVVIHVGDNHAIFDLDSLEVLNYRPEAYVHIEDHVWVGQRAAIIGDARIGKGAVVAGYAVVKGDVDAMSLVAGNPAAVKRQRVSWTRSYLGHEREKVRNWLLKGMREK